MTNRDRRLHAVVLRCLKAAGAEPTMGNMVRGYLVLDDLDQREVEEWLEAIPDDALPPPLPPVPMDPDFTVRRDSYLNRLIIDVGGVPDEATRAGAIASAAILMGELADQYWHLAVDGEGLSGPWRELLLHFAGAPIELPDEDTPG